MINKIIFVGMCLCFYSFAGLFAGDPVVQVEPLSLEVVKEDIPEEAIQKGLVVGILAKIVDDENLKLQGLEKGKVNGHDPLSLSLKDSLGKDLGGFRGLLVRVLGEQGEGYFFNFAKLPSPDAEFLQLKGKLCFVLNKGGFVTDGIAVKLENGEETQAGEFHISVKNIKSYIEQGEMSKYNRHIVFSVTWKNKNQGVQCLNFTDSKGEKIPSRYSGENLGSANHEPTYSFFNPPDRMNISVTYSENEVCEIPIDLKFDLKPKNE